MKHIENSKINVGNCTQYGVTLERTASALTQGVPGPSIEGTRVYGRLV